MDCSECKESLRGKKYVQKDPKTSYCIPCHEKKFCNTCIECNKVIGVGQKDLNYGDKHFHESCFSCDVCKTSLADKEFEIKDEKRYCEKCLTDKFGAEANQCPGCKKKFERGQKKMEYKGAHWHEDCFKCYLCKKAIGSKSFYPRAEGMVCEDCYNDKVAKKCSKCDKTITGGGVTYKDQSYHTDCFLCESCEQPLAGKSFTKENNKNYCADCFAKLFAKTCDGCKKPIMEADEDTTTAVSKTGSPPGETEDRGQSGAKFVSFEDRNWHNDCFLCTKCKESLVGKGFNTEGRRILCPNCVPEVKTGS